MGMWKREPKAAREEKTNAVKGDAGGGSTWTQGRALSGRAGAFVLYAAIACGPLALVTSGMTAAPTVVAQPVGEQQLSVGEQASGSFAAGYVGAWLSATRDDNAALAEYIELTAVGLSDVGWAYRDLSVSSVSRSVEAGLVTVVIAANVREVNLSEDGAGDEIWPRRYFQVTVKVDGDALSVVGLPAPIAAPERTGEGATLVYSVNLPKSEAAADTVTAFLNAYLAGSGEIDRYISPNTDIHAVTPAPYVATTIEDIRVDAAPSKSPRDGDAVEVLATVVLQSATDQQLTSTYALTLTARDGRWEVGSINLAPIQDNDEDASGATPAPTTTPDPSSTDDTEKGK